MTRPAAVVAPWWLSLHFSHVAVSRVRLGAQIRGLLTVEQVNNFNLCGESRGKVFSPVAVVKDRDTNLVLGKNHVRSAASLGDSVSAPSSLEAIVFSLNLNVGPFTLDSEWGTQVVEGHQKVQVGLSL